MGNGAGARGIGRDTWQFLHLSFPSPSQRHKGTASNTYDSPEDNLQFISWSQYHLPSFQIKEPIEIKMSDWKWRMVGGVQRRLDSRKEGREKKLTFFEGFLSIVYFARSFKYTIREKHLNYTYLLRLGNHANPFSCAPHPIPTPLLRTWLSPIRVSPTWIIAVTSCLHPNHGMLSTWYFDQNLQCYAQSKAKVLHQPSRAAWFGPDAMLHLLAHPLTLCCNHTGFPQFQEIPGMLLPW